MVTLPAVCDAIAGYVDTHPTLSNIELHLLAQNVFALAVNAQTPELATAMVLSALIAVRDAPDAVRGDTSLPSHAAAERRIMAIRES